MQTREIGWIFCQGECADEFFLVTGGSAVPPICGVNNAQHLIIIIIILILLVIIIIIITTTIIIIIIIIRWTTRSTSSTQSPPTPAPLSSRSYFPSSQRSPPTPDCGTWGFTSTSAPALFLLLSDASNTSLAPLEWWDKTSRALSKSTNKSWHVYLPTNARI